MSFWPEISLCVVPVTDPWFNSSELSHKHRLCEEQCTLVHWGICHPIPLLRENERWVFSLTCIPVVSVCMGLGTMAASEIPGWPGSCRSSINSQLCQLWCWQKVVDAPSLKLLKAKLHGARSNLIWWKVSLGLAFHCRCWIFYPLQGLGLSQFSELSKEGKGIRAQDELWSKLLLCFVPFLWTVAQKKWVNARKLPLQKMAKLKNIWTSIKCTSRINPEILMLCTFSCVMQTE